MVIQNNKNDIFNSFKWSYLAYIIPNLILPILTIIIARTLSPSDYGIFSMNLIFVGALNIIQALGIRAFIIKETNFNESKKSTLFYLSILLGICSYIIILIISPLVSLFFNEKIINDTLPLLGLILIFNSFGIIHLSFLEKYFKFQQIFFVRILPLICVASITLPLALNGFGFKALIYGEMAKSLSLSVSYFLYHRWIPKFLFDFNYFKEAINFGKWISLERILEYFLGNIDKLFLGFFFGTSILGLYSLARQIINILFGFITGGIVPVLLPLLSSVSKNKPLMLRTIKAIFQNVIFLNFSLLFFIAIASINMFEFVLPNWENIGFYILILSLGETAVRSINSTRDIYKINNKPKIYPKSLIFNVLFSLILYPIGMHWFGLVGFFLLRIMNDYFYLLIQYFSVQKLINIAKLSLPNQILSAFSINCITFTICYYIFTITKNNLNIYLEFLVEILLSISLFVVFQYLFNRKILILFFNNFLKIVGIKTND